MILPFPGDFVIGKLEYLFAGAQLQTHASSRIDLCR